MGLFTRRRRLAEETHDVDLDFQDNRFLIICSCGWQRYSGIQPHDLAERREWENDLRRLIQRHQATGQSL